MSIIPDYGKYPDSARDLTHPTGEIGLAGHWIKHILPFASHYEARAHALWWILAE